MGRVRRRLFRQTRSSASEAELKSELFADFSSRASTPNERMLETSYNCQVEFELVKAQTEECKTIIEFVASNGEFLKTEKENSRMVRNAYKWNKNDDNRQLVKGLAVTTNGAPSSRLGEKRKM